jgi:two-component system response regulator TrcR
MEHAHILLVEDELFLAKVIKDSLEQNSYRVSHVSDGRSAFRLFQEGRFTLCIVDVMLPQVDGFTLVKQIRTLDNNVPVLFLTARTSTKDVVEGYESGGNDYLKKPFSLDELFLRVKELLKRSNNTNQSIPASLFIGAYEFNPFKQTLQFSGGEKIKLSYREAQLLQILYNHKNNILDRKHVLLSIWGDDSFFNARTMDVFITKLRKHLRQDSSIEILNLRGVGFKLLC